MGGGCSGCGPVTENVNEMSWLLLNTNSTTAFSRGLSSNLNFEMDLAFQNVENKLI